MIHLLRIFVSYLLSRLLPIVIQCWMCSENSAINKFLCILLEHIEMVGHLTEYLLTIKNLGDNTYTSRVRYIL